MDEEYARKLHAELNKDIDWDVAIDHVKLKAKEDPAVKRYQAIKRKPQTEAQARKNMMMYLKNVAGFKLDYFKGMSYDDIRPIFEPKFNSNVDILLKTKEQIEEEENRALISVKLYMLKNTKKGTKSDQNRTKTGRLGRMIDEMDKDDVFVLMDDKEEDKKVEEAKVDESAQEDESKIADVQEVVDVVTTAKLITKIITAASATIPTAEPKVLAATLTAAPARVIAAPSRRRKGVVIRDPEEESTTSKIIPYETKSKDKGKGILVEEPKPLKKKQQIEMDEEY
nr:hypothetical protein [Tanacetum cinerariifolium]GFA61090.1 hypothetical protein [Tanacetum cinerariifolium]